MTKPGLFSKFAFADFDLHPGLRAGLTASAITVATSIQAQSFVPVSARRDAVLCSETGSGKTAAYLVPLLNRVMFQQEAAKDSFDLLGRSSPPVVVLCPTGELCKQVLSVASQLDPDNLVSKQALLVKADNGSLTNVLAAPRIRWGAVDLVVSTPHRFAQDIERFREDSLLPSTIVFDEADLLFHGSTQPDILNIIEYLRPRPTGKLTDSTNGVIPTQFVFASATLPDIGHFTVGSILAQRFSTAEVIRTGRFHSIPASISSIEWVPELAGNWEARCHLLTAVLHEAAGKRVLVFVNTTRNCHLLHAFLRDKKWPVARFTQSAHHERVGEIFTPETSIVVATDIAARGIDWKDVDLVVNFQMPTDVVTWLHRAGRCGRLGRAGAVVSFFKAKESPLVDVLKSRIENDESVESLFSHKRSLKRKMAVSTIH